MFGGCSETCPFQNWLICMWRAKKYWQQRWGKAVEVAGQELCLPMKLSESPINIATTSDMLGAHELHSAVTTRERLHAWQSGMVVPDCCAERHDGASS